MVFYRLLGVALLGCACAFAVAGCDSSDPPKPASPDAQGPAPDAGTPRPDARRADAAPADAAQDAGDACPPAEGYAIAMPPKSLDALYPEQGPSTWVLAMFEMQGPLGAMGTYLQAGEMAKAQAAFQGFKAAYAKTSKLVPEWTSHYFPAAPVAAVESALQAGDPAQIGKAMGELGSVCGTCHGAQQPGVWARYHYKDLEQVKLPAPAGGELAWDDYMQLLSGSFSATMTYLAEEQAGGAFPKTSAALSGFQQAFAGLNEGCKACHGDEERKYYVSADVTALLDQAAAELAKPQPDASVVTQSLQAVGGAACGSCHVAHSTAAHVQHGWEASQKSTEACAEPGVYRVLQPPQSMDQHYPENGPSAWVAAMFEMEGPLGAFVTHLQAGEMDKAMAALQGFKAAYTKTAKLVPEWTARYFLAAPVANLESAVQGADPAAIGKALGELGGGVCGRCHGEQQPGVWARYHGKDLSQIAITDPASGKALDWEDYMHALSGGFSATATYLAEEQAGGTFTKTTAALTSFKQTFEGLKEGCKACHGDEERRNYVSADVVALIDQALAELAQPAPDAAAVMQSLQGVGAASCGKCHVLHSTRAHIRHGWNDAMAH